MSRNEGDTVDYGPLAGLAGVWQGDEGFDTSSEPDGTEANPYIETLAFEAIGDVENAQEQVLAVLRHPARTSAFEQVMTLDGDRLAYEETTHLEIYGRTFLHTDCNELTRTR